MKITIKKFARSIVLATAFCSSGIAAQQFDITQLTLQELLQLKISTASKEDETIQDAPATVYLITEQDIKSNGYYRLQDVLENVPGIMPINLDFFSFGGVRGLLGNFSQTLIMINGREVQNLIAAETFISEQFATDNIERIEIINGPGSALYGANALLGVINIKTKTAGLNEQAWQVSVDYGSENKRGASFSGAHKSEDWRFALSARYYETGHWDFSHFVQDSQRFSEGFPSLVQQSHNIDQIGYDNTSRVRNLSFEVDYKNFYFGSESFYLTNGKGLENVSLNYRDQFDVRKFRMLYAGWSHEFENNSVFSIDFKDYNERFWGRNHFFKESIFDDLVANGRNPNELITPAEVTEFFTDIYSQQLSSGSSRRKIDFQYNTKIIDWSVVAGYTYDEQDILGIALSDIEEIPAFDESVSIDNSLRRPYYATEEHSVYIQVKKAILNDRLNLTLAGRIDDHSIYDTTETIRSGFVYQYSENTNFKVLYGEAFREPNIFEQGAQNPPYIPPNLDLNPAEIKTWEFSINQNFNEFLNYNLVLFDNQVNSLIVPVTTFTFTNSNQTSHIKGVEGALRFQFSSFSGDLAYTWLDPEAKMVAGNKVDRLNVPENRISFGLNYDVNNSVRINSRFNWYDEIAAEHGNPNIERIIMIDSASKIDFNIYLQNLFNNKNMSLMFGVKNIFDETWYQPNVRNGGPKQFLQPGRQWQLRYTWAFQ